MQSGEPRSVERIPGTSPGTPGPGTLACGCCDAEARVHVLDGYRDGQPLRRTLCLRCPHVASVDEPAPSAARSRPRVSTVIVLGGLVIALVSILGDFINVQAQPGFGWYQRVGVAAGALLTFLGALVHADLVVLGGAGLVVAALGLEWLESPAVPGLGWKQTTLLAVAAAIVLAAALVRMLRNRRRQARAGMGG